MISVELNKATNLQELVHSVDVYLGGGHENGTFSTAVKGLSIIRADQANQSTQCLIKPALYVTAQGAKWATFGDKRYLFEAGQALVVAVDIPARGTISLASPEKPYLGLALELDFAVMQEVAEENKVKVAADDKSTPSGAFVLNLNRQMIDSVHRAIRLLDTPEAIPTLYPGIMRELCYWLLSGTEGSQIIQIMILANAHDQKIIGAIHTLRESLSEAIHVEDLASAANMSPATFHRQFKSVTGMAPLQYQKQLRLHEARRLLIFGNALVESASVKVGYASVSQFSREYTRLFGSSPRRDVSSWRSAGVRA